MSDPRLLPPAGSPDLMSTIPDGSAATLGDFQLLRSLGEGTTGRVYLAEQLSLHRKVALKVLRSDLSTDPVSLKRFQAEAEAIARLPHANIVQIYAVGAIDGLSFMALEYVDGKDLRAYLPQQGRLRLATALAILRQIAAALQRAHEGGVIHRDIKPANVLVTRRGEAKVTDFGLSRCLASNPQATALTQAGELLGTPLYMSPEQVRGQTLDPRTDLYSLGATAYHLLSGQPPFTGQNAFDVAIQHVEGQTVPLHQLRADLPAALCAVIHRMMAKNPDERYQTGQDVVKELRRATEPRASTSHRARSPLTQVQPTRAHRQRRAALVLALAFFTVVAAGARLALRQTGDPPDASAIADSAPRPEPSPRLDSPAPPPSAPDRVTLLREKVEESFDPTDVEAFRVHLDHTIQLGLLYLNRRQWKEAQAYFDGLRECPANGLKVYAAFGRIGLGAVYAFRNRPKESNRWFLEVERVKPSASVLEKIRPQVDLRQLAANKTARDYPEVFLLRLPALRKLVGEALNRNADNLALPEPLESLRTSLTASARP